MFASTVMGVTGTLSWGYVMAQNNPFQNKVFNFFVWEAKDSLIHIPIAFVFGSLRRVSPQSIVIAKQLKIMNSMSSVLKRMVGI